MGSGTVKLLLDTHIWLWSTLEPNRLSRRITRELSDQENELWLSAVSVWELTMLIRKKKMQISQDVREWVGTSMKRLELSELPITIEVALEVPLIDFSHGDPADHLLAASAKVFDMVLVTADKHLMELHGIRTLANN